MSSGEQEFFQTNSQYMMLTYLPMHPEQVEIDLSQSTEQ